MSRDITHRLLRRDRGRAIRRQQTEQTRLCTHILASRERVREISKLKQKGTHILVGRVRVIKKSVDRKWSKERWHWHSHAGEQRHSKVRR